MKSGARPQRTYASFELFHLFRYLDEHAFRFSHRKDAVGEPLSDFPRSDAGVRQVVGKRLTFEQLTSKTMGRKRESFPAAVL